MLQNSLLISVVMNVSVSHRSLILRFEISTKHFQDVAVDYTLFVKHIIW